jgi:hypothetical protein
MPMTTTAGDVGIRTRADQRAEMKIEVGAELQPTIRVRNGQRALDVVRDGFARRVRQVVDRQNDDVVSDADATILAAIALKSRCMSDSALPALGLDVVNVCVLASANRLHDAADVDAVFDDGIAHCHVAQRDLVAERDVLHARQRDRPVFVEDETVSVDPAATPSTTTTATESLGSCSTQWIMGRLPRRGRAFPVLRTRKR